MTLSPAPERFVLPVLEPIPVRPPFPLVAALAPIGIGVAIAIITGSAFALLFAVLGPVVAVAGLLDSRRHRRSTRRVAERRVLVELGRLGERLEQRARRERERLGLLGPAVATRVGTADLPDPVVLEGEPDAEGASRALADAAARLRAAATRLPDAPVLVDHRSRIGVVGAGPIVGPLMRSIATQFAGCDALAPTPVAVTRPDDLPSDCGVVIRLDDGEWRIEPTASCEVSRFRPQFIGAVQARALASASGSDRDGLPDRVDLEELLSAADAAPASGLTAPIGRDDSGVVFVDLVAQGPHALVAGTTGSGKSELLVAWVLAMAATRDPDEVTFLLVDFKGGASFAPLRGLPHVVGTLSDLDDRLVARAVESLRAELRRRERLLAERAVRSIDELPDGALARLVIVVDEFAALLVEHPDLHPVFSDLSARGRSLGLHLVLCTQRPSGVVRDAVLANITLRLSLRVTDRLDSIAVVGTGAAAALPPEPRGRAVLSDGGVEPRVLQLAIAGPSDVERCRGRRGVALGDRPWRDPLPERLEWSDLPPVSSGYPFGLADVPAEQAQPPAVHLPERHGALLVLGAGGAGKSTALASLAAGAGGRVVRMPTEPADAWGVLTALLADEPDPNPAPRLVLVDDLDALIAAFGIDHRGEVIELIARLAREGPSRKLGLVATAQSTGSMLAPLAGAFGSRLVLRLPTREEHVMAGADAARFDPSAPPGCGVWRGMTVQVAVAEAPLPPPAAIDLPCFTPAPGEPVALVAGRPRVLRSRLAAAGVQVRDLGETAGADADAGLRVTRGDAPLVVLGDPDAWNADWALLGRARREWPIVLVDCGIADHRAITRSRELPPPLGNRPGECWLVRDGVTERARFLVDR